MSTFFRTHFSRNFASHNPNNSDTVPFHTFYNLVNKTGGAAYRIMLIITVVSILCGLGAAIISFVISGSNRTMSEAKMRIQRLMFIAFAIGATSGFVNFIFIVFNWD